MFDFNIDIDHIILQRLRMVKRTPIAVAQIIAWAAGLKLIYSQFITARNIAVKKAKVRGTKIYLEKLLNETFGITGIQIVNLDPEGYEYVASGVNFGFDPVYLNDALSVDDVLVGDNVYYNSLAGFEVQIPAANYAAVDQARLRAVLNEYILATINYNIVSV